MKTINFFYSMDKWYIHPSKCKTFANKSTSTQKLINHTLFVLDRFGIPMDGTPRRLERMALVFLAVADVKRLSDFELAKDLVVDQRILKTRDVIDYVNTHFEEHISRGSYDDIRRKDLKLLLLGEIILSSNPNSDRNDSTRGYGLNPVYATLVRGYPSEQWSTNVQSKLEEIVPVAEQLKRKRQIIKVPVSLPSGKTLEFSPGPHNQLQKAIIEEFLPRYGYYSQILYVGDAADKFLHLNGEKLEQLNFFEVARTELPDVVAYSEEKNWLYLIEAVHSSGTINEVRLLQLKKITEQCRADIVYVTAFLNRKTFRKFTADIAWETEVWIADDPDHLIHFNGGKFLGPYKDSNKPSL